VSARFFADVALSPGLAVRLPDQAARHVQVLRLQPGDTITLFNGRGDGSPGSEGEFTATIDRMGRSDVDVTVGAYRATTRELPRAIHLAMGMPANERMDWLVEKATELGATSLQPLVCERSVLRLKGERADKKLAHWRAVAAAASEQCGRNRLPVIHDVLSLTDWLQAGHAPSALSAPSAHRLLLSLQPHAVPMRQGAAAADPLTFLSGPEGGLSPAEEAAAMATGFVAVTLGPRVLRAETAPLTCLAILGNTA